MRPDLRTTMAVPADPLPSRKVASIPPGWVHLLALSRRWPNNQVAMSNARVPPYSMAASWVVQQDEQKGSFPAAVQHTSPERGNRPSIANARFDAPDA
jgi:hypothetical protein